jgi:phosphatidylserine/phosphatidylglycerophosphate/cardiolipin synthase-like enzyme/uncharacterized protein YegP (UPF0339 family)
MRFRSEVTPSGQVFAVAGTNTVSFGIVAADAARSGLLGYAVARRDVGTDQWRVMDGFKVFESVVPKPAQGLRVSTTDHPVQSFMWDDFLAEPDRLYEYEFRPAKGEPGALTYGDPAIVVVVRTEPLYGGKHDVFFNRGVASSQFYSREFGSTPIDKLSEEKRQRALAWLSRDLDDALLRFIDDCQPGDRLEGCFYEFHYEPALKAFARAIKRGVDVQLIVDAKENQHKEKGKLTKAFPREANLASVRAAGIPMSRVVLRVARRWEISHNKFMVRTPKGRRASEVWTGSTNLSRGGVSGQTNVGHWVRDPAVAAAYRKYWALLSTDPGGRSGDPHAKALNEEFKKAVADLSPVLARDLDPKTPGMTVAFSPRPDLTLLDRYAAALDKAKRQGCITLAFGVAPKIKDALMDNTSTGPLEFLLLEKKDLPTKPKKGQAPKPFVRLNSKNNVYSAWGAFLSDPVYQWVRETSTVDVGLNTHVAYIHSKFMLVDPLGASPLIVTGSANFSDASTGDNDENMLIIRGDQRAADIYYTEFNRLFNHYYFRSVVEDTSRRRPTSSPTQAGANRFLQETDAWTTKYKPGSFRSKHLALVASMADAQVLPVTGRVPTAEPQLRRGLVAGPETRGEGRARSSRTAAFEVYQDRSGKFRWRLRAANGEVVAQGQSYKTRAAARKAVDAVRRSAAYAT